MLIASCHCGDVRIEMSERPVSLTECNWSICRRYGALLTYCTSSSAKTMHRPEAIRTYCWNDEVIEFVSCNKCGCLTHYEDTDKSGNYRIAVNARMMDPKDLDGISLRLFNGESM